MTGVITITPWDINGNEAATARTASLLPFTGCMLR